MQSTLGVKRILCASALVLSHIVGSAVATAALPPTNTENNFAKFPIDGKNHTYKVTLTSNYIHPDAGRISHEVNDITVVVPATIPGTGPTNSYVNLLQYDDKLIISNTPTADDLYPWRLRIRRMKRLQVLDRRIYFMYRLRP
jgi:hypothetical protein